MADGPNSRRAQRRPEQGQSVESLASQALSRLVTLRTNTRDLIDHPLAETLRDAAVSNDPGAIADAVARLHDAKIGDDEIVDLYIPHVARRLGEDWVNDDIGFAATSIGASRLQGLLRELERKQLSGEVADAPGVAVVVLAEDDHTLGAMVLTHQLRRMGISVRLLAGVEDDEAARRVTDGRHDAVFLSASRPEGLGKLGKVVEKVRKRTGDQLPVVVGGRAVEQTEDAKDRTGADFATSNLHEALSLCGLIDATPHRTEGRR